MIWLLIGYMFLFIHRPFEVWPELATVRLELLYMLVTGGIWLALARKRWIPNGLHTAFFAFAGVLVLSWVLSAHSSRCELTVENYIKLLVFYLLLVTVVRGEDGLRRIALAYLIVMAVYMGHSLLEYVNGRHVHRMGIARLIGVDMSLGDPNSFAATIIYALPFVLPFWRSRPSSRLRWFLAGYVGLSCVCVALTGSRSGLVGLLLFVLIVAWRTRWRLRLVVLGVFLVPVLWTALPGFLQNRFETIINPDAGPANAQASAQSRLDGLIIGVQLWERNPLTGCGPGAWRVASRSKLESHNLYGQIIGETGTLGALAFAGIVAGFWVNLRRFKQLYAGHPEWGEDFPLQMAKAVGLALVLLLFMGNFGHNLYRYSWLWYGGFLIITRHCVEQRLRQGATALSPRPWVRPLLPVAVAGRQPA